jgi:hypothetical protein
MVRPLLLVVLLSVAAIAGSSPAGMMRSGHQKQCSQEQREWVGQTLQRMQTIKPGMSRKDLLEVFTTEGGLSTGLKRTFVSQDCPYFKVDVEFEAVGRPSRDEEGRVTLVEDDRDVIVQISRPYVQLSIMD